MSKAQINDKQLNKVSGGLVRLFDNYQIICSVCGRVLKTQRIKPSSILKLYCDNCCELVQTSIIID